jgi:hypothetical protein
VGIREILETYLNSLFKNTSETDIFPYRTKSVLTSVISACCELNCFEHSVQLDDQMSSSRARLGAGGASFNTSFIETGAGKCSRGCYLELLPIWCLVCKMESLNCVHL